MATDSRATAGLTGAAAVLCLAVGVIDALGGNSALGALFGFLGLTLALQTLDDLVWEGGQPVVAPLKRIFAALTLACALWVVIDLLL